MQKGVKGIKPRQLDAQESHLMSIVRIRDNRQETPEWAANATEIRQVLLRAFPRLATSRQQRERAGRWNRVIQLYFRSRWTPTQTANEMSQPVERIKQIIKRISRVSKGLRADGTERA